MRIHAVPTDPAKSNRTEEEANSRRSLVPPINRARGEVLVSHRLGQLLGRVLPPHPEWELVGASEATLVSESDSL